MPGLQCFFAIIQWETLWLISWYAMIVSKYIVFLINLSKGWDDVWPNLNH